MGKLITGCALLLALAACQSGFKEVDDAGQDAAPASDLDQLDLKDTTPGDLSEDLGADAGGGCSKLVSKAGPVIMGYGEADSMHSATVATSTHVVSVWERYYAGGTTSGSTFFSVQEHSGKVVVKELMLDESEYPSLPAMAAINDQFGVLHVRNDQDQGQQLQYLRVDLEGAITKKKLLASGLGQYAVEPTIAAGAAGIAVGYTVYDSSQTSQMLLGKIDKDGEITRALSVFPDSSKERRHIKLLATDTGFVAVWTELQSNDLRAVVAAWLDSSLNVISPPGEVVVTEDSQVHQRPSLALDGEDLMVCHESLDLGQDADITCRRVEADGTVGPKTVSFVSGLSSRRPQVAAVKDRFAVLWTGVTSGLEEVHMRLLSRDGSPVTDVERISEPSVRSWYPSVAGVGQSIVAGWFRYVPITVYYASFRYSCEGS